MNHFQRISDALRGRGLDAMLLTSDPNCFWATYFHGEGVTLVTRAGSFYFTDSRYIEAAQRQIDGAFIGISSDEIRHVILHGLCDFIFSASRKIRHQRSRFHGIAAGRMVQQAFQIAGYQNIHGRRGRQDERAVFVINTGFKEIEQHFVFVGRTDQPLYGDADLLRIPAG